MPIEDVDYLKQNSIVQSYIFLVDSKDRDHESYPTPSEYVTTFTSPFTNVIGIQLIDASIPRTMYNIDSYNNTIVFYINSYGNTTSLYSLSNYKTVEIDPGNYTIQTLLPKLTEALTMNVNNNSNYPVAQITAQSVSTPPELKNKIDFRCAYPFAFDMKNSTIAETLGFDLFPDGKEMSRYKKAIMPDSQSNQQVFRSVNVTTNNSIYSNNTEYSSYCNILSQDLISNNAATVTISNTNYLAQSFTVPERAYISTVAAAFNQYSVNPVPYSIVLGTQNTPNTPILTNTLVTGYFDITDINGGLSTSVLHTPLLANTDHYYWLMIGSNIIGSGSNTEVYYCSNVYVNSGNKLLQSSTSGLTWTPNIHGNSSSNQLVTNIDGDLLNSAPVLSEKYNLFVGPRGVLRKLNVSATQYVAQRFTVSTRT